MKGYVFPLQVFGGTIRDAQGGYVADLSSPHGGDARDAMAQFLVSAANAYYGTPVDQAQTAKEPVAYQRRNIGPDETPWSSWYLADDKPTPQNMKFDGHLSYEYRPLYPGKPIPRPDRLTSASPDASVPSRSQPE